MPETDVIFKFEAVDDLSPILDKIRDELDAVTKSTQQVQGAISKAVTPPGGGGGVSVTAPAGGGAVGAAAGAPASAQSWQQVNQSIQQATTSQSKFAHQTHETSFAMEQMHELMAGIGYTIGAWNIGFFLAEKAVEAVGDAFKNATNLDQNFVEQMNLTRSANEAARDSFDDLKKAALEAGMDLGDEFQKFVIQTVKTLETLGLSEKQAGNEVKVLGQYMRGFGVDMRDLAAKTELGVASFDDLLKAGQALGPMFQKEVLDWKKFEIGEAQANAELQRYRQLMNESYSDTQRLASAHEGFAQSTGLAASAFKAFRDAQLSLGGGIRPATWANIPTELANLPGGRQAFGKLLGEMQSQFKTGIQQMAKEMGLSEQLVTAGVKAGLPGFDEQAVMSAQKRAVEEREIARHRGEETEDFQRRNAAEQERIKLNREVNGILKEQAGYEQFAVDRELAFKNYQESIKGTTDNIGKGWTVISAKIGDAANALKESNHQISEMSQKLHEMPITPAAAGWGPVGPTTGPSKETREPAKIAGKGGETIATDKSVQDVHAAIIDLKSMLQGH